MLKYLSVLTCVVTILAVVTGCDDRGTGITHCGSVSSTKHRWQKQAGQAFRQA